MEFQKSKNEIGAETPSPLVPFSLLRSTIVASESDLKL